MSTKASEMSDKLEDETIIVWFGTNGVEWRRKDWRSPRDMSSQYGKPREYVPLAHVSSLSPEPSSKEDQL